MKSKIFSPLELKEYYNKKVTDVSQEEFFNKPMHSKNQEIWCATYFSQGYSLHIGECFVCMDDVDVQKDYDFELIVNGINYPFQVTEVQEPGRKRGLEYKKRNISLNEVPNEDWSYGADNGPQWIRDGIIKKINKCYANSKALNLLVYVDFSAWEHDYNEIFEATKDLFNTFASIWLLNGEAICSLHSYPELGYIHSWKSFNYKE